MALPAEIARLIETYERNRESYAQGRYSETQLRREYLDPFFKALGWDVDNTRGWAEAYKDVIHEDAIRIGSSVKAPDYCFRIGGTRKFFVEAKAPSVNLKDDPEPAFQLRRYAWSAKLPLSVLTDFEEFAVYDCRVRPHQADKSSKARTKYWRYTDYAEHWDEIASIFAYDAVLKGSFDKFATSEKRLRGTAEVDAAFLAEIETWRESLARHIALRNPALTNRDLNYAVQITIDRIIFLRICEDRGIERYGQLMGLLNGPDVYPRLMAIFRQADDRYNSGLFHFLRERDRPEGPDELTPDLVIDDKPLKDILRSLYYPESPYEFSVLPAEILGQVYEQFLGKVITLTAGHHARVEDKPEVKKAGGVFYTPAYIVDYIVQQTVGKLLEDRTVTFYKTRPPRLDRPLRVLDPACGSGSFLLGAYQLLLDWYRAYYEQHDPETWAAAKVPPIYQAGTRGWQLTLAERKRILLDHIFGVDIDPQAVEVTKLSLLLRVLEGEKNLVLFHNERALPDLAANIKCGNSLIGPDFYQGRQGTMFDQEERLRINAFDWHAEFPEVFQNGGFDAVIGNPPWGAYFSQSETKHLISAFPSVPTKTKDSYFYFVSQGLRILAEDALLGFIVPNTWLLINYAEAYRRSLLGLQILEIRDHGDGVFKEAVVESCTLLLRNAKSRNSSCRAVRVRKGRIVADHVIDTSIWKEDSSCRINIDLTAETLALLRKLSSCSICFVESCIIKWGIKPYQVGYGNPPQTEKMVAARVYHSDRPRDDSWKPLLVGSDVDRYRLRFPGNQYIKYGKNLMYPSDEPVMLAPKILIRQTSDRIRAVYDDEGYYCQNSVFVVSSKTVNLHFLLGILNSRLLGFVYSLKNPQSGKIFAEIKPSVIKELPIRRLGVESHPGAKDSQKMIGLVETMLRLHKILATTKTPTEKAALERQIAATDGQIDQLVYELYGLTDEETRIVETATPNTKV